MEASERALDAEEMALDLAEEPKQEPTLEEEAFEQEITENKPPVGFDSSNSLHPLHDPHDVNKQRIKFLEERVKAAEDDRSRANIQLADTANRNAAYKKDVESLSKDGMFWRSNLRLFQRLMLMSALLPCVLWRRTTPA
jgi:hypothetical protein